MSETTHRDLIVIGAGPGGYVAALHAAHHGKRVTLVEKRFVGGTCLNVGCIPTKALVHAADVFQTAKNAAKDGILADHVGVDFARVQAKKDAVVETLVKGVAFLLEKAGVETVIGTASFAGPHAVDVACDDGIRRYEADNIIIATGAKTRVLPIPGFDLPCVMDSEGILSLRSLPASLVVVGAGIIGMEFAFAFARLGVKVDVLEALPDILPMIDREAVTRLSRFAKQQKIQIETDVRIARVEACPEGGAEVFFTKNDVARSIRAEVVLSAVGRVPELSGLQLEQAGIAIAANRGIAVDDRMRTNVKGVYAIGDVTNLVQLAHAASRQAIVAVDDLLGHGGKMEYRYIPSVLYTTPAVAWVGRTEADMAKAGLACKTTRSPFGANGRALIQNQPLGFVKLVADAATGELVGATILGEGADELIATVTVALQNGITAEALEATIFAHPTVSETIHEAAAGILGAAIHYTE